MAFIEVGNEGSLNGTTAVDVVSSPGASTRRLVSNVKFNNIDTATVTVILLKYKGGTTYEIARETLQVNEHWEYDSLIVCDATDEKVQAKMSGAAATTNPTFDIAAGDAS